MAFQKGQPVKGFPFVLIDAESGSAITTGTVSGFVTLDGGIQASLADTPIHEGSGQWSLDITGPEMDGDIVGLLFTHASAIPAHFTINTIIKSIGQSVIQGDGTSVLGTAQFYGTISEADNYFANERLNSDVWVEAIAEDKNKALIGATRVIDYLNFSGVKLTVDQVLQFPRGADTVVPEDIRLATYETGINLLDDFDIDQEIRSLEATTQSFSSVRSTYDRTFVPEHIRAGVPSIFAWNLLKPYLRDPAGIQLSRVS